MRSVPNSVMGCDIAVVEATQRKPLRHDRRDPLGPAHGLFQGAKCFATHRQGRSLRMSVPSGVPNPVQPSQPAPALYPLMVLLIALVPEVTSCITVLAFE